jgi:hypothetical protein
MKLDIRGGVPLPKTSPVTNPIMLRKNGLDVVVWKLANTYEMQVTNPEDVREAWRNESVPVLASVPLLASLDDLCKSIDQIQFLRNGEVEDRSRLRVVDVHGNEIAILDRATQDQACLAAVEFLAQRSNRQMLKSAALAHVLELRDVL